MIGILHNIRSQHNVGSIFRTADAAGFEKIYLTGVTPAPLDNLGVKRQKIAKVSLGAEDYLTWEKKRNLTPLLRELKRHGYQIVALEQSRGSVPYHLVKVKKRFSAVALVVGNEIKGLPPSILSQADQILEIPMLGRKESLNVAVAFGIVAYQLALAMRH